MGMISKVLEEIMKDNSTEISSKTSLLTYYERYMLAVGIFGQFLFYAQGIKIFLTRSASDVSIFGFLLGFISVSSWLVYGILIKNRVLVLSNIFAVVGALFVIIGILIYGN
jgi:MtN3 and saliva related transmembrane protein